LGCRASLGCWIEWAKIGCSVNRIEEPYVDPVEEIEGLGNGFEMHAFCELKRTGKPEINGLVRIALESIAWFDAYAVVVAEDVTVGVKTCKLGEVVR